MSSKKVRHGRHSSKTHKVEKEEKVQHSPSANSENSAEKNVKAGNENKEHMDKPIHKHESHTHKEHKKTPEKEPQKKSNGYIIGGIIILLLIAAYFVFSPHQSTTSKSAVSARNNNPANPARANTGKVKFDLYVMSQCPFGTQVENALYPVIKRMGDNVDLNINYIASKSGDSFNSLHGQKEVKGDMVQLCAKELYPSKYFDLIACQNKNARAVDTNWESCADSLGMDKEKLRACLTGDEGKTLLSKSIDESNKVNARASPTIYINGKPYNSGRDSLSFQRAICNELPSNVDACANMPECGSDADCNAEPGKIGVCNNPNTENAKCTYKEPVKFNIIVLNDKTCSSCDTSRIVAVNKKLFKGVTHKYVDISSDEGKKLVKDFKIEMVPAYLFENKIKETAAWKNIKNIQPAFDDLGKYLKLKDSVTGANHFVDEKKKEEFYKKIGVVKGDNKPQIDFFVMSYCPYGNQAEELVYDVYKNLGDKAEYKPHYVIYENYRGGGSNYCADNGKICSMHGIQEVHEDMREMCVYNKYGIGKWFDFAINMNKKCSAGNADSCWESVAKKLGIDVAAIKKCQDEEGVALLQKEKELDKTLSVSGSPTIFIDGDKYSGARSAKGYQTALCDAYDTSRPAECSTAPDESASSKLPASGGCGV